MAVKLTEQTNGPHIFMRLRLDSGRVEEIDAYISEEGWRYVGFLPVSQTAYGAILEYDLIFEQEKK